jgi:hypothetical protein
MGISGHLQCQFFPPYFTYHFSLHSSLLYLGHTCKRDSFTLWVKVLSGSRDHSYTLQTCLVLTLWKHRTYLFLLCFKLYLLTMPFTLQLLMWNDLIIILHLQWQVLSVPVHRVTLLYLHTYGFYSELGNVSKLLSVRNATIKPPKPRNMLH